MKNIKAKIIISMAAALAVAGLAGCSPDDNIFLMPDSSEEEPSAEAETGDAQGGADENDAEADSDEDAGGEAADAENADDAETEDETAFIDDSLYGDDAFDIVVERVVMADYSGNTSVYLVADDGQVYDCGYVALDTDTLLIEEGDVLRITATDRNVILAWDFDNEVTDAKKRIAKPEAAADEAEDEAEDAGDGTSFWWNRSSDDADVTDLSSETDEAVEEEDGEGAAEE